MIRVRRFRAAWPILQASLLCAARSNAQPENSASPDAAAPPAARVEAPAGDPPTSRNEAPPKAPAPPEAPAPEAPAPEPEAPASASSAAGAESPRDPAQATQDGAEDMAGTPASVATEASAAAPDSSAASASESTAAPAQDVTVVGTRVSKTAGSAHLITRKQLERFAYTDPLAVVQQAPGVYVRQEDGIGLRPNIGLRGANADRSKKITLMEDGILFGPAPYSAPAAYYFPLISRMSGVRVIKGPSAVAFGPQTVGGAIDFLSRPIPDRTSAGLKLGTGEYGYGLVHAHFGTRAERIGFLVEGVRLWNTGFKHLPNGADTGSTRNDWMVKLSYELEPSGPYRNEFLVKLSYADEVSNETYLGLTDQDFRADPYQRYSASALDQMKNHRSGLVVTHRFEATDHKLKLTTSAYRHDYARIWRKLNRLGGATLFNVTREGSSSEYLPVLRGTSDSATGGELLYVGPNDRTFVSQGVQTLLNFELNQAGVSERIEVGLRLHDDRIQRRHSEDAFLMQQGELVPTDSPTLVTSAELARSTAVAMHALAAVDFWRISLTPGVRAELIHATMDDFRSDKQHGAMVRAIMPGMGAYLALTDQFGVLGGVHRGFSPPPPPESLKTVRPEYSVNYEAGARYSAGPRRVELIGFLNHYANLTDVCSLSSGCVETNLDRQIDLGRARIYGMEGFATEELKLPGQWTLPLTLAYTLTHAKFSTGFTSSDPIYGTVSSGDELPYIPRHQLKTSAGIERQGTGHVALALSYVSAMRELPGKQPLSEALATDEQIWLDASSGVHVWGPISAYANLRNIFNSAFIVSRRPYGARPNAPRWLEVGLRAELK